MTIEPNCVQLFMRHCSNVWVIVTHTIFIYVACRHFWFNVVFESSTSHITNDWAMCCNDNELVTHSCLFYLYRFRPEELSPTIAIYNYSILYAMKLRRAKVNETVGSHLFSFLSYVCPSVSFSIWIFTLAQMLTVFATEKLISIAPLRMDNQIKIRYMRCCKCCFSTFGFCVCFSFRFCSSSLRSRLIWLWE